MDDKRYDVIIVGAGLAGLSCAYELSAKGKKVLVIEANSYAGGRTSSFVDKGMKVESGLHRYIGYYSALPRLLSKCGIELNKLVTWEEKADVLVKDKNKKMVLGVAPLSGAGKAIRGIAENEDVLSLKDKLSLVSFFTCGFSNYLVSWSLDDYSVAEYADKHHVTERAKRFVLEPLSSGIFFMPPKEYSAYAFFGLFAPAIPKFYKMKIGAFLGGMTETMANPIVNKIREQGGDFLFGEPVKEVIMEDGGVVGVRTKGENEYLAKTTVIAATLPAAKNILAPARNRIELNRLFNLPCMSACTMQLELTGPALKKDITTFGPGTDMVSFAEQSRSTFRKSQGRLSVILGKPEEYSQMSEEKVVSAVVEQMESLGVHIRDKILDARKVAERNEFYSLSKGNQLMRPRQKTGIAGLVLAGDYTRTSSFATMEGAVISGRKAADISMKF